MLTTHSYTTLYIQLTMWPQWPCECDRKWATLRQLPTSHRHTPVVPEENFCGHGPIEPTHLSDHTAHNHAAGGQHTYDRSHAQHDDEELADAWSADWVIAEHSAHGTGPSLAQQL